MVDRISDPIGRLMGLRYKSHPWHGVYIGKNAPEELTAFIEVVSTETGEAQNVLPQFDEPIIKSTKTTNLFVCRI